MGRIPRATLRSWWLAALLSAGCTSYHKTSLTEIQSHPDNFVNKKVRVHYAASGDSVVVIGRTVRARAGQKEIAPPDSSVALYVAAIHYPLLSGKSLVDSTTAVVVDVTHSSKVEVRSINWRSTIIVTSVLAVFMIVMGLSMGDPVSGSSIFSSTVTATPMSIAPPPSHQSPGP